MSCADVAKLFGGEINQDGWNKASATTCLPVNTSRFIWISVLKIFKLIIKIGVEIQWLSRGRHGHVIKDYLKVGKPATTLKKNASSALQSFF